MQNLNKMKVIYNLLGLSLILVLALSSCSGKDEVTPPTGGLDYAEQLIQGTYVGTWSKTNLTTGEEESSEGTVVFSWNDELGNNVSAISVTSEVSDFLNLEAESSACNISKLSSGVLSYWNVYPMNPLGTTFTGKVSPEGECTMDYNIIVVIKRKETEFKYSFVGNKQ